MAAGGIYDQLGGGFARYSTDDYWLVPHFEKMLYDNALLTRAYLHAYLVTGEPRYQRGRRGDVGYVLRDLRRPRRRLLLRRGRRLRRASRASSTLVARRDPRGVRRRRRRGDRATTASPRPGTSSIRTRSYTRQHPARRRPHRAEPSDAVQRAREQLLDPARAPRPARASTTRCCSAWNALFLAALDRGRGRARPRRLDAAAARTNAPLPAHASSRRDDGRFLRSWRAPYLAYAEDYAALLEALLHAGRARRRRRGSTDARPVADELIRLFHDADGRRLLHDRPRRRGARRPAEGRVRQRDAVGQLARGQRPAPPRRAHRRRALRGTGGARCSTMLGRVDERAPDRRSRTRSARSSATCTPPIEVAIVGDRATIARTAGARARGDAPVHPELGRCSSPSRASGPSTPLLADRPLLDGVPTAYVCEDYACRQPVTEPGRAARPARRRARRARVRAVTSSRRGDVGAGRELFGDGPAERDHRLARVGVELADERDDLRAAGRLDRAGVEHRHARGLAALDRDA